MQFIEQLTLVQTAAIGGSVALILALLLIAARRKRAAAQAPAEVAQVNEPKKRKRDKPAEASLPRRKRRKLAAEAAHAMGVEQTVAPSVPAVPEVADVPVITIPEVTIAAAPMDEPSPDTYDHEPVPAEMPVEVAAVPAHLADDPYLQGGDVDASGAFVAQPGWPSPGELASSFDPDAFDPLPEAEHHPDDTDSGDTTALELPMLSTAEEVVALEEIEEWADTYDVEEDWAQPAPAVSESAWNIPEDQPTITVSAIGGEDDAVWSEPDEEPMWEMPEPAEAHPAVETEPIIEAPSVALMEDDGIHEITERAWSDDSEESWTTEPAYEPAVAYDAPQTIEIPAETYDVPVAYEVAEPATTPVAAVTPEFSYEAPDPALMSNWNQSLGGPNSPVVLDLAGLAASGHALELVIEPNADGNGVRLRFGAPGSQDAVELPVVVETAQDETPLVVEAAEVVTEEPLAPPVEVDNLAFLAGDAPQATQETTPPAVSPDSDEAPAAVIVPESPTSGVETPATVVEAAAVIDETAAVVDEFVGPTTPSAVVDVSDTYEVPAFEPVAVAPVADVGAQVADVREPDDDPAQILADIRARLAALDARR